MKKSSFGSRSIKGSLPGRDAVVEADMFYTAGATRSPAATMGPATMGTRSMNFTRSIGGAAEGATQAGGMPTVVASPKPLDDAEMINRFPENPTPAMKHRLVFEELDLNNQKSIKLDGLRRVMKALNMGFTSETVDDLFARMDVQKTGAVAFPGFLDWAEHYPVVIDAIYYRSRELVERARRESQIDATRQTHEALQRAERLAQQQYDVAHGELETQQRTFRLAEEEHQRLIAAEKECSAEMFRIAREVEILKTERNSKELDFQVAKDQERAALKPVKEIEAEVAQAENDVASLEDAVMASHEKERQLESMLEEIKKETGRLTTQMQDASDDLADLKRREKDAANAHEAIKRDLAAIQTALSNAETELSKMQDQKHAAEKAQQAANAAMKAAQAHLENEERKLGPLRERDGQHKNLHLAAAKRVDDADAALREKESDLDNYIAFRNQTELDEYPLMEHEVRLREQRYNLDDRDEVHYDETTRFINTVGHNDTRGKTAAR